DPMLPAQVRNRDTALSLADHTHDLGVTKAITLHQNLLNSYAEKILIQKSLFLWGDYQGIRQTTSGKPPFPRHIRRG
ncbi:hypothetical protein AZ09_15095, partial (plasmid) [Acetobacter aceti 1023]